MKWLESVLLAILTVFAPIKAALITVFVLTIADMILGIVASKRSGIKITSAGIKKTVGKLVLYEVALCLGFIVQQYLTGDIFPAAKLVSALIGLVELKSILENLDLINGNPLFKSLVQKIVQSQEKKDD